ncbi:hypothetical protein [Paludifilum halophilum]|uniref:hypothetical protein n=1 Tax=Paludifilum halophilum TaxID=1642702 RepID=UPI00146A5E13|nr:hypothetical protein [Paludifilum halophilum]
MHNIAEVVANYINGERNEFNQRFPFPFSKKPVSPPGEHYMYQLNRDGDIISRSSVNAPELPFTLSFLKDEEGYRRFEKEESGKHYIGVSKAVVADGNTLGYVVLRYRAGCTQASIPIADYLHIDTRAFWLGGHVLSDENLIETCRSGC